MVVVADTSPLNYLVLIGEIRLLPELYGRIWIPDLVLAELKHSEAPLLVSTWAAALPEWIDITSSDRSGFDPELRDLEAGEAAAIFIAQENTGALLLMDEARGRAEAARRHILTIGTLGILRDAAVLELVDLAIVFAKLRGTSFRVSESLLGDLLARDAKRKKPKGH